MNALKTLLVASLVVVLSACAGGTEGEGSLGTSQVALVSFDPESGTGFVGKGDVQSAFGWNNSQLQANESGLSFSFGGTTEYSATCEWTTGEGTRGEQIHQVTYKKKIGLNSTVTYDARRQNQVTGFFLTGFAGAYESGSVPVVGGACHGAGREGTWIQVDVVSSTGTDGLRVHFGELSAALTIQ